MGFYNKIKHHQNKKCWKRIVLNGFWIPKKNPRYLGSFEGARTFSGGGNVWRKRGSFQFNTVSLLLRTPILHLKIDGWKMMNFPLLGLSCLAYFQVL